MMTGSHTSVELVESGYNVTIIDNLQNSFLDAFERMKELVGDKAEFIRFKKARVEWRFAFICDVTDKLL